jgi:hypothetical protein
LDASDLMAEAILTIIKERREKRNKEPFVRKES